MFGVKLLILTILTLELNINSSKFTKLFAHSWMVTSPGRGLLKSRRWAVLLTHWLIRYLLVFYISVSPMLNIYQVLDSVFNVLWHFITV